MQDQHLYERYQRQMLLKELGEEGQRNLLLAKVLVMGAGGLGCPALQYLVAAGVGTIGIVDDDTVSLHNLHRQILYSVQDIGLPKAEQAAVHLKSLNPDCTIISYPERITTQNALDLIQQYDIIIDGTDNFATRYLINDACVLLGKPFVYGAISQFEGQVAVFNYQKIIGEKAVSYRDLFPVPPKENEVLNCAEAGVLGVLPGIIGTMQANEVIKLITGIGQPLANQLLTYNALTNQVYSLSLTASAESASLIPKNADEFKNMNYDWLCAADQTFEINPTQFKALLNDENVLIIDVREKDELPIINEFDHLQIPLARLQEKLEALHTNTIITICQTGKRSRQAAQLLFDTFGNTKQIYSLQGGVLNWIQHSSKP